MLRSIQTPLKHGVAFVGDAARQVVRVIERIFDDNDAVAGQNDVGARPGSLPRHGRRRNRNHRLLERQLAVVREPPDPKVQHSAAVGVPRGVRFERCRRFKVGEASAERRPV